MNRNRFLFIGLLALALGAVLSSAVYRSLQARNAPPVKPGVDVVIAANDLQVGSKLQDRDLKVVRLPAEDLPAEFFKSTSSVIGRGVVLPIAKGEFILPAKLAAENAGAGLPSLIPRGMRAVSVRVNEVVSVAGFVVPGTRVDVLLTGNPTGSGEAETTTVLQGVLVLAAGQKLERNSSGENLPVPVITVAVSPEDAQKLTLASSEGRIQLALRNPLDTTQDRIPGVLQRTLFGAAPPPPNSTPAKPPTHIKHKSAPTTAPTPTVYGIEVITGEHRDQVKVDDAQK